MTKVVASFDNLPKIFLNSWALTSDGMFLLVCDYENYQLRVLATGDLTEREPIQKIVRPRCAEVVPYEGKDHLFIADDEGNLRFATLEQWPDSLNATWNKTLFNLRQSLNLPDIPQVWQLLRISEGQVLIAGFSQTQGGFIAKADLRDKKVSLVGKNVDEAPWDMDFSDGDIYIAAGRSGCVILLKESDPLKQSLISWKAVYGDPPFKPMRIRVLSERQIVLATSYNRVFQAKLGTEEFVLLSDVCELPDCINDIAVDQRRGVIYFTCTYSNQLKALRLHQLVSQAITPVVQLERPCWVKLHGSRLYVLGHSNGKVWALEGF